MIRHMQWLVLLALLLVTSLAQAGTVTYVYSDPQGTPLAEADANGNITARFEYTPYGVSVTSMGAAPNGVGYTGHVNDPETGLVYMQARYYDAEVGRFLSVDPVGPSSGNGFNFNRYAYASNSPVNRVDPNGMNDLPFGDCSKNPNCIVVYSSDGGGGGGQSATYRQVDRIFANYRADPSTYNQYTATLAEMPRELTTALEYILASPMGQSVAKEALARGEKIGFLEIPDGQPPGFRFDMGSGLIMYTLKIAEFKARYVNNPSLLREVDVPLDVNILHEIGHTPIGRSAFGIGARPSSLLNEFEDVRKAENPYRQFYGFPLRTTYNGYDIQDPIIQHP